MKMIDIESRVLLGVQGIILVLLFVFTDNQIPPRHMAYIGVGVIGLLVATLLKSGAKQILAKSSSKLLIPIKYLFYIIYALAIFLISDLIIARDLFVQNRMVSQGTKLGANLIVICAVIIVFDLIFNSVQTTIAVTSVAFYVLSIAVWLVYLFRGVPIVPWDIWAIGTAADVAVSYRFVTDEYMIYGWIIYAIFQQIGCYFPKKKLKRHIVVTMILEIALIAIYAKAFYPQIPVWLWDIHKAYTDEGFYAGFIAHVKLASMKKPDGYEETNVEKILAQYEDDNLNPPEIKAKNIIMIMNESYADLSCLGAELQADYMPFTHSLDENAIKADLVVPVFGGGTCNTEFEALTGNTCLYCTQSPYMTVIRNDIPSIARTLKKQGFACEAYHPGGTEAWNRNRVYQYMGFDSFNRPVEGVDVKRFGAYTTDETDYDTVIKMFETRDKAKPYFMFNVTIQNHGGFEPGRENLEISDEAKLYSEYEDAEVYLSLMQESDKQIERLISYFEKVDEPTVVCFFGDHLPALSNDFLNMLADGTGGEYNRYTTPFFIWTNYDIDEQNLGNMSANYISPLLLETAGVELSSYDRYLIDLKGTYPVISVVGISDEGGQSSSTQNDALDTYKQVEYYQLKHKMQP